MSAITQDAIDKVKALLPRKESETQPTNKGSGSGRVDVKAYLNHYGVAFQEKANGAGTIYSLENGCLFDPSHMKHEASIIQQPDGKLIYQCFHDSCQGRIWKEARQIISGTDGLAPFMEGKPNKPDQKSPETKAVDQGACLITDISRGFHFQSVSDLCVHPVPTQWLIKPYLDAEALASIFGPSGSMKTFEAVDIGMSVASGKDWHGHSVKSGGAVFYILGEGFSGMSRRTKAWSLYHGVKLDEVPFYVSNRPAQFLDKHITSELVRAADELAEAHGKPALIIIDTLNRNFGPGDENSTADMTLFISIVDEALRNRYRCTVLTVHHSGLTATDRARGASAFRAALDWEYRLSKNQDGTRTLDCTKAKDHAEPPPLSFMPKTVMIDEWVDDDNEIMTSCVLVPVESTSPGLKPLAPTLKVAFEVLLNNGGRAHIDRWRDACYSAGISPSSNKEAKKKAFQRAVKDLLSKGYVATKDDYWWVVTYEIGTHKRFQ